MQLEYFMPGTKEVELLANGSITVTLHVTAVGRRAPARSTVFRGHLFFLDLL